MASSISVSELDFDKIKQNMVDYFRNNPTYSDWNFEGSGLSVLMDVLAYNTQYNALTAHLSTNETFLDTAQLRGNVVSRARELSYCPRSATAATAIVDLTVGAVINSPQFLSLERGTRFSTIVDSQKYSFVVLDPLRSPQEDDQYVFTSVILKQGTLKRMIYNVDSSIDNQKFEIPDFMVDTSTMRVRIKSNQDSSDYSIFTKFTTLVNISELSQIYHLQENSTGRYEIYFGDGILGKKLTSNNIVEIEYIYTDGAAANGATAFVPVDEIDGLTGIAVEVTTPSYGGAAQESIESIRYNAPMTFISQNRAVTADDYKAIIQKEVAGIESISVWGGEDAVTPDYGKVYIAVKPTGGQYLTSAEKNFIINVLKGKNVVSITPLIIDPVYTIISLDVNFKYNPNLTDRTLTELQSAVRTVISDYNDDNLQRFDGVFRYSQLLRSIDLADPSILNSSVRVFMYKDITPLNNSNNYFDLEYSSPIFGGTESTSVLSSSSFLLNGVLHYFGDEAIKDSADRTIYTYKYVLGIKTRVADAGIIYPSQGRIVISDFRPDTTDSIRLTCIPNSDDLAPKRNQLLEIDQLTVNIHGEIDSIALAGSAGAINYVTSSRVR